MSPEVEAKYAALEDAPLMDESIGSESDFNPGPRENKSLRSRLVAGLRTQFPWTLSAVLFVLLCASWAFRWSNECGASSFERGFDTELIPAKQHIRLHKVQYRGTPIFDDNGEEYVKYEPGEVKYVGKPSPEIDEAWRVLTTRRFFLLSDEEAREQWGPAYTNYWNEGWGGYAASMDMFHTLHCLDHIRKSLYPDYYHQGKLHGDIHNGHCIDHIRQQIMCQGDLTPLPSQFFPATGGNYLDSDRQHVCRDFGAIRAWVHERYNASLTGDEEWTGHYKHGHEGTSSWGPM